MTALKELQRTASELVEPLKPMRGGLAPWQVQRVQQYIMEHLAETIRLNTLAAIVKRRSPSHFCWAFKQSVGVPPITYQFSRRIERAKKLLQEGEKTVTAIAKISGYSGTSSFTAAFRHATGQTPSAFRGAAAEVVAKAKKHIEENLDRKLSLPELAAIAERHPQHFCRAFKKTVGEPPGQYHLSRRIERAKKLLQEGEKKVIEIGLDLGYSDPSSFAAAFKRKTGLTPSKYRQALSDNHATSREIVLTLTP